MTFSRTAGALAAFATLVAVLLATALVTGAVPLSATDDAADAADATTTAALAGSSAGSGVDPSGASGAAAGETSADAAARGAERTADELPVAARDGKVTIDLVGAQPVVARPGDTVTLTVRVTNGRDAPLTGAQVDLGASWQPITSRESLASWAQDSGSDTLARQLSEQVDRIPAGRSAQLRLRLPVDILDLESDAPWGPRPMSLAVVAGGTARDVLHTFLLFAPQGQDPAPVSLSVVAPVTGPAVAPDDPDGYSTELDSLAADGARLDALADAGTPTAGLPGITLAVDPALVAAASGSDQATTAQWAQRLTDGSVADVATLPAFDPDVAALAHAGIAAPEIAAATGAEAALPGSWTAPTTWGPSLVWPQGRPDVATLGAARAAGADHVLVADGLSAGPDVPASARTAVETDTGKVSALVADRQLSDTVARITTSPDAPTEAEAAQQLLADTALLATAQQAAVDADDTPARLSVLAALPRDWTPDAATLQRVLGTLDGVGWSDVVPLAETVDSPATDTMRDELPRTQVDDDEIAPASVRELTDARRSLAAYATVADDPVELAGPADRALVSPLALAFRPDPEGRDAAVGSAVAEATELQQGISVADRSSVTLVSDSGDLPVLVRNDLPTDATVTVVLRPDDPRLKVETRPTVVVPAGKSSQVQVKVRAIGSGNVDLGVEVLAPSGVEVAEPTSFAVTVRAGWETVGTAVVAAAVALLFIAGIWRTVRRGRSSRRTTGDDVAPAAAETASTEPGASHDEPAPDQPGTSPHGPDRPRQPDPQHEPSETDRT